VLNLVGRNRQRRRQKIRVGYRAGVDETATRVDRRPQLASEINWIHRKHLARPANWAQTTVSSRGTEVLSGGTSSPPRAAASDEKATSSTTRSS